ncbi:MAG: hypothetical protein ABIY51_11110 [Ferruginibacter sp.]
MKINRHNYETFFLMYADNELSVSERATVEQFVQLHPDLKEELSLIMETILPIEPISFTGKNNLLKTSVDELMQEKLLLHLDNELDAEQTNELEKIINTDKLIASEWMLLQVTKLDAGDTIVFKVKSVLYRRERDNVVVMRFVKYAVAAALIGMGFYFGIFLIQNNNQQTGTAVAVKNQGVSGTKNDAQSSLGSNPVAKVNNTNPVATEENNNQKPADIISTKQAQVAKNNDKLVANKNQQKNTQADQKPVPTSERSLAINPLPKQHNAIPEHLINIKEEQIASLITKEKPATVDVQDKTITPLQDNNSARLAMLDANKENADDRILFMNEEKVTRTKAAGFLRKLKRTVERKTRIRTGDEIKIAGFSFALK